MKMKSSLRKVRVRGSFGGIASFLLCVSLLLLVHHAAVVGSQDEPELQVEGCEEEEKEFDSEVRVATLQFSELQIEFLVVVFVLLVILAKLVWHHELMHPVSHNIPESCMLIVMGAHIGGIIVGSFYLDECNRENEKSPPFKFTPRLFFIYLLPPIVLEAGYFLNNRAFFENIVTILVYAVVGTIFNACAVGLCLFGLFKAGLILTGTDSVSEVNFTISSALLFGTITAAVDPVAVLAVFEEIHVNKMLHILVFGESLLNDAVTIVLFQVLGAFANRPFDESLNDSERDITVVDGLVGIAQFIVVVTASIIIGLVVGMAGAFFTRFTEHVHVLEPIVVFAIGYLSYLLADIFAFSGIVSLIVTAIVMRHYVEANISRKSHTTIKYTMKVVSNVAEMIIFLFLGISLYDITVHNWDTGLVICTIVLVLLFRPIGVIVLTLIVNIFRIKKISWKSMFIMSYSGLRGAVAFSLALVRISDESELDNPTTDELTSELQLRRSMLTAVTVLVLFTVFIQGTTIKPIVGWLKVRTEQEHKMTMNEAIHTTVLDHITAGMEDILGHVGHNRVREKIREIDYKYLRRIFERHPEARDEQILHTFKRLQYMESAMAAESNAVFKWHLDSKREEKCLSLYTTSPEPEEPSSPEVYPNEEELAQNECEDQIPHLDDILKASFVSPHESHYAHVLSRDDRDCVNDHRFEPVAVQRAKIRSRHRQRKKRRRIGQKIRNSALFSGLGLSPAHRSVTLAEEGIDAGVTVAGEVTLQQDEIQKPTPNELEVELHELRQHQDQDRDSTAGIIIPGSTETDV